MAVGLVLGETGQFVSCVPESRGSVGCRLLQAVKMSSGLVEIYDGAGWHLLGDFLALLRFPAFVGIVASGRREGSPL